MDTTMQEFLNNRQALSEYANIHIGAEVGLRRLKALRNYYLTLVTYCKNIEPRDCQINTGQDKADIVRNLKKADKKPFRKTTAYSYLKGLEEAGLIEINEYGTVLVNIIGEKL